MKRIKVLAFMNAFTEGKSGGDVCMIESLKRMKNSDITVVTSQLGKKLCGASGLRANYFITSQEKEFKNVIKTYLLRIFQGMRFSLMQQEQSAVVLYVSSDALPDVLPALIIKFKSRFKIPGI